MHKTTKEVGEGKVIFTKYYCPKCHDVKHRWQVFRRDKLCYDGLTVIIWALMQDRIDRLLECFVDTLKRPVIINWILLPKTKYFDTCDIKYLVKRDENKRISSVLERDGISLDYLQKRDESGIEYDESAFDWVVFNNG